MAHGANVAIIGRNVERLQSVSREFEQQFPGLKCLPVPCDVRSYDLVSQAFDTIMATFKAIHVLINGAAGNFLCLAEKLSSNGFKTVLEIDTIGTFHTSKACFVKYMKKHGGVILNLSATLQVYASPAQMHAGVAKAAIDTMTKHLAVEWGLDKVRVNAIQFGAIESTEGFERLVNKNNDGQFVQEYQAKIPLQRFGTKQDIANVCLYLASDAASYITGSIVCVDGGSNYTHRGVAYPQMVQMMSKQ